MKTAILILLIFTFGHAQEIDQISGDYIVYLDDRNEVTTEGNHARYRIISDYAQQLALYDMVEYYKSGKIQSKGKISDKYLQSKEGIYITYYENGGKRSLTNYKDGEAVGPFYTWYPNDKLRSEGEYLPKNKSDVQYIQLSKVSQYWTSDGVAKVINGNGYYDEQDFDYQAHGKVTAGLKDSIWNGSATKSKSTFTEIYDQGKLISGVSTDEHGIKHSYDQLFVNAKSKKGIEDFYRHIAENIRLEAVHGKIIVHFYIETDGSVKELKTVKGLDKMHDQEALRIVRNYRHWTCAELRGIKIRSSFTIPIIIKY